MIVLLVEGATENALKGHIKQFLDRRAEASEQPKVALRTKPLMTLDPEDLATRIQMELATPAVSAVVGLIDVYPNFPSAQAAKDFLRQAAGQDERFHAHAAQYEVEAWLLPYWADICSSLGVHRAQPGAHPEEVDLLRPPSQRLAELYRLARPARTYTKPREMAAILRGKDLTVAAEQCPEFKALLNTLLALSGLDSLTVGQTF